MGVFSPHTRLIVLFGEPNPQGFVLVPECRNLGWTDLRAKGMPCVSGAPCLAPRAYKACVGLFSNRCGTPRVRCKRLQGKPLARRSVHPRFSHLGKRTNPCGLGSPERTMSRVCGEKTPTEGIVRRFFKIFGAWPQNYMEHSTPVLKKDNCWTLECGRFM